MKKFFTVVIVFAGLALQAQEGGKVTGVVIDAQTGDPVPFANVLVQGTDAGASTDVDGKFTIENAPLGYGRLRVSSVGYESKFSKDIYIRKDKEVFAEVRLTPSTGQLDEVVVESSAFERSAESPNSVQTLGVEEIERNPGANRDVSRVINSLPGVTSTPAFRNDILIRGGAPNENVFYVDGIETPVINHFQTQGSSGGPVGILNANLLQKVTLYTGAFPANRGNMLSSVLEIEQKEGNRDKMNLRANVGASEVGLAVDGPLGEKTTYNISARQSYLQLLFGVLGLPFLPTFNDAQYKIKHKFNDNHQITFVGLGALDRFRLNESVNDRLDPDDPADAEDFERNQFILGNLPVNEQWNYTVGAVYKHVGEKSFQTVALSRNMLDNRAFKFRDNDDSDPANKILDFNSTEAENKVRIENTTRTKGYRINAGINLQNARYTISEFNRIATRAGVIERDFESALTVNSYGAFGQISKSYLDARLDLSFGFRIDGNDYNTVMRNGLNQFSPRFSATYALADRWDVNLNVGRYYQLPPYTALGFRNTAGVLENRDRLTYIQSDQVVTGVSFRPDSKTKISVEGFYKHYRDYPFSLDDSVSLANLGADFGVVGNSPVISETTGRAYGGEFFAQRRARKGFFGILSYTYVVSEFEDLRGNFVPSSWDARHILSLTAGKKFKRNWELGAKWRYVGGLPYTPVDVQVSSLRENWDVTGRGLQDFSRLNSMRLSSFQQLDIRVDKTWFFDKWSLNLYVDIQNFYNFQSDQPDNLNVRRDDGGDPVVSPTDPRRYQVYFIENTAGTVLPTIGVIADI